MEFLTLFYKAGRIVVYAGAAPGTHIPFLADLFPGLTFYLIDPAEFWCSERDWIIIKREFFTDKTVPLIKEYAGGREILFISDVRSADPKVLPKEEVEDCVARDMESQMKWAIDLDPVASMHKFRLPYGSGTSKYLDGKIYLPIWGPETTTETRLIVTNHQISNIRDYDNTEYEQQMFYFNTVTRVRYHLHNFQAPGIDHCFDCVSEIAVLRCLISFMIFVII